MSLALRLGRTLEELGDTMTAAEFSLWLEFYREHPWDGEWLQTGIICATIANYAGKTRAENVPPSTPKDYMPPWGDQEVVEEPDPVEYFSRWS